MAISHETVGTGEHKVNVLHDWLGTAEGWAAFRSYLDGEAFTYAFLDFRGYGSRKDVPGEYTLDEISADAIELADQLGWQQFSLVGHSMGGKAAQRVLADAPDRVVKLVGITPVPASAYPADERTWGLFSAAVESPEARKAIFDLTTGNRNSAVFLGKMVEHSLQSTTKEAFGGYLGAWVKTDFASEVTGNKTPVKVLYGEHDRAFSRELLDATWGRFYPNADLEVVANAGHYPMYETPVALATAVESFLRA
jgi:pimeloyl-ACP methyl ester carboxylesterase